ncbi:type II secretion system F family protein [Caminicella sporogenes]|uniref:type II secretion system F family protein n=1 Tax=Caminicella sporogenes TaxID=166485 RepID=UPI002540C136|nr:type II secretion system F family protein [Caminicella sporogenes]WIF94513.1 type II secretion system F family protein [Caminicella sporogenes]
MPIFKYKAVSSSGEKIDGVYETSTKNQVINMLKEKKYFPIFVEEVHESKDIKSFKIFNKVKIKDISIFCRQFYVMLNAGVAIINCLDILRRQTENKKLKKVIEQVYEDVQKGAALSEAMKKHDDIFPELFIYMIEAGEVSGTLDIIMERMANHYEKENKIQNKVKGAMVYPIILSIISLGIVTFLLTFVMPTFVGMFEGSGVKLPLPTRILLSISDFLKSFWYAVIIATAVGVYILKIYIKTESGKVLFDNIKMKIPVVRGTTQKVVTSRFTRTLSTLLSSGIPLIQALEVVSKIVQNKIVEKGLISAKEEVRKGTELANTISRIGFFPPMVISMIKIGEGSGALDEILDKTANYYDEEVEVSLQKMITLLEPFMIVIMALVVGAIVISMVLPMFDMINTVKF